MLRWSALPFLSLLLLGAADEISPYFADWGMIGGRPQEPTCVDIPQNMPLCSGIDYTKMRLPNLLDHDTLKEAQQQAGYWVPLLNLQCHPDTQLFLCSLFTPVCLETPIFPCRSLCVAVRSGCERRMQTYSFPWPDMLNCDKFPLDNDMCITVQNAKDPGPEVPQGDCEACSPVETYENILDNYCRSDVVVKSRIKKQRRNQLVCRKAKIYKSIGSEDERRALRRPKFSLTMEADCCALPAPSRTRYLIMGRKHGTDIIPTFVMPIKKSKPLRQAMKMFKRGLNCSDPNLITRNLEPTNLSQEPPQQGEELEVTKPKGPRRNRKGSGKRRKTNGGRRRKVVGGEEEVVGETGGKRGGSGGRRGGGGGGRRGEGRRREGEPGERRRGGGKRRGRPSGERRRNPIIPPPSTFPEGEGDSHLPDILPMQSDILPEEGLLLEVDEDEGRLIPNPSLTEVDSPSSPDVMEELRSPLQSGRDELPTEGDAEGGRGGRRGGRGDRQRKRRKGNKSSRKEGRKRERTSTTEDPLLIDDIEE